MYSRRLSINRINTALDTEFGDMTVTLLSLPVTDRQQEAIAGYFMRTFGSPCCRACGEDEKKRLYSFGENIFCRRCAMEHKEFCEKNSKEGCREMAKLEAAQVAALTPRRARRRQ